MEKSIIGREKEIERLKKYVASERSEFLAIYGRRRVGKTFLVKELFDGKFAFKITGKENANLKEQLLNFSYAFVDYFGEERLPSSWAEAFRLLSKAIEKLDIGPKIIFIDELPWLDTPRSNFVSALESFWNEWAYYRSDVKLIVCGSATSWMLNKLINTRGGLHNRVTHKILISPFSLRETELYFKKNGFDYERPEIIDCYMAVGGVAYYLSLFDNARSVAENINDLCFTKGGELTDEFSKLYKSIFKKSDSHIAVINALSDKGKGMTRLDLIERLKLTNNGNLGVVLDELEACEFIRSYVPFGKVKKDKLYQLIDQFSLFYFQFMKDRKNIGSNYWIRTIGNGAYNAWCGYAFEMVCLHHVDQIIAGLGISGIVSSPCSWIYKPSNAVKDNPDIDDDLKNGAQIDLLIDRDDKTVTICEMKYSDHEYEITKAYDKHTQDRIRIFKKVTKTPKSVAMVYVSPQGLSNNMYSRSVKQQIIAKQLFM